MSEKPCRKVTNTEFSRKVTLVQSDSHIRLLKKQPLPL
jgi:hypothetical protein